ncbi:MAG: glycerophosphodiester phosphodiesterase family protein [Dermatophilus congolensis]|nr:glycerophosphodiester phosphodiesterase family protein [Dermatophilus congolensis]
MNGADAKRERRRRRLRRSLAVVAVLAVAVWLLNTSLFASKSTEVKVLAHRGVTQTTSVELDNDDCFAAVIDPPRHEYVENTLASMKAAFDLGADGIELDVHPTTDGEFVVFHDWTLDCATDGTGVTREQTSTYIRGLDPAYRYTADTGRTFPLRGKWKGQIPLLSEVLAAFPDKVLFINVKSDDPAEGDALARYLADRGEATGRIMVYGGDQPVARLREVAPQVRAMGKETAVRDLVAYEAVGWTGFVPGALRGGILTVPLEQARFVWGWPARFSDRMAGSDTAVVLLKTASRGDRYFDTAEDLTLIPPGFRGYVMTDEVEAITRALGR